MHQPLGTPIGYPSTSSHWRDFIPDSGWVLDPWETSCACLIAWRKSIEKANACPVRGLRIIEISYLFFGAPLFRVVGNRGTKRVRASDPFNSYFRRIQMQKSLITTLVAVPLLSLSSMVFAAEPASSAVTLTAAQMDVVTAGYRDRAFVFQYNASPVTTTQVSVLNIGSGDNGNNVAYVTSGNFSYIRQ
jgi:hypothetical protein